MTVPVIAFFNNKGGVGKTSLVYHIAWMLAEEGYRVVAVDLDPQGNLSAAFLDENRLEQLWPKNQTPATIYGAVRPLKEGTGDVNNPDLEIIIDRLALIAGDMDLSQFEDDLSEVWPKCLDKDQRSFRVMSAFWRVMQKGANHFKADVILIDLGPNLGAINRSALIAADSLVIPLGPDMYSLQGLRNLGPRLKEWREQWNKRREVNPVENFSLPKGKMEPLGYIVMQHAVRRDRPVRAYDKWISKIPAAYRQAVLGEDGKDAPVVAKDDHCLALLKHYRSLMPMAQEAGKPVFYLKSSDGAIGAHTYAVQDAHADFERLAREIVSRAGVSQPDGRPS